MSDIRVEQTDNVWARVFCNDGIAQELSEFFTYTVPSARFNPSFKAKHWDGKIRLFSIKTHKIYAGLIDYIIAFAKDTNYSIEVKRDNTIDRVRSDTIPLPQNGITPHDYQWNAVGYALTRKRGIIISPTASGKSLICYMIARYLLENGKKQGLLIVPTISLVEQMYGDFKEYGWDVEANCQMIYQGHEKAPRFPLVISTWQSIFNMPKKFFKQFDFVIGDEAHQFKADSLKSIMTGLTNADYRIGTTGTLDGSKVHKLILEGLFGPVKQVATTKKLMDEGKLAELEIKSIILQYPEEVCKTVKGYDYQAEIGFLIENEARNKFIRNLVEYLPGNTLILYNYVDRHGRPLYDLIKEKITDRPVFFVCGLTAVEDREQVRHLTEKETNAIIVASYGTFSTGINIKHLHNVVFASPTKSQIRTLQSIGRGLRLGENKKKCTLYDLADDLRYRNYVNHTLKHYERRMEIYNAEKFSIKTRNIGIR